MQDLLTIGFGTAVGFTVAGLLASGYDAVSGRQLRFAMDEAGNTPELLMGMLLRVVAGPYLLIRNVLEGARDGASNPLLLAAMVSVACMWGCLSGVIVLDLLGGFTPAAIASR